MNSLTLIIILLSCVALGACGEAPSNPAHPEHAPLSAGHGSAWTLRYTTRCNGTALDKCSGAYGLSLFGDGHFEVGPGPNGEILSGELDPAELTTLQEAFLHHSGTCSRIPPESAAREHISVTVGSEALRPCDAPLLAQAHALSAKYYPPVFPNPCIAASLELEKTYASVSRCETDTDCSFLDDTYTPIAAPGALVSDDCTFAKPLVVANGFQAIAGQLKLVTERDLVRRICGTAINRPGCSHPTSIQPVSAPPRCVRGTCRSVSRIAQ